MQNGIIKNGCYECNNKNCGESQSTPAYKWEEYDFAFCPFQYITPQIESFFDEYYSYDRKFCAPKPYNEVDARWFEAVSFFSYVSNKMQTKKYDKSTTDNEQKQTLKMMFEGFKNGKK